MSEAQVFQRLERAVSLIARHPNFPGKQAAVDDCLEDLEERYRQGVLTHDQKSRLTAILTPSDEEQEYFAREARGEGPARAS